MTDGRGGWKKVHGMNWIHMSTRLAIYARDRFDCVWCRQVFPVDVKGYGLSLDHLIDPMDHRPSNLVTACPQCNTLRGSTLLSEWLRGRPDRRRRMNAALRRPIQRDLGRLLAAHRKGKVVVDYVTLKPMLEVV